MSSIIKRVTSYPILSSLPYIIAPSSLLVHALSSFYAFALPKEVTHNLNFFVETTLVSMSVEFMLV